ncbi:hypothetical protein RMATCC62417_04739 [Rhizopus microsporus]|nr:hypothetical protein RMATCC62417_04739 [Rhizopus microsporus]
MAANSKTTIYFLYKKIFCNFGPPKYILSDNCAHFVSEDVEKFVQFVNTRINMPCHTVPKQNGRVEQFNGTLVNSIRKLVETKKSTWDEVLHNVLYAYRTKAHGALEILPYELLYGVVPNGPENDVLIQIGRKFGMERLFYKKDRQLDRELKVQPQTGSLNEGSQFPVGSQVIHLNHLKKHKLDYRYKPKVFTVLAAFNNGVYILANPKGIRMKRAINGAHLKKYIPRKRRLNIEIQFCLNSNTAVSF